jgi:hypothetical protein
MTAIRTILAATIAFGAVAASTEAGATSMAVKMACASDYFAHCSQFDPDSKETRQCMRKVGRSLSQRCLSALVAAGEAPKTALAPRVATAK